MEAKRWHGAWHMGGAQYKLIVLPCDLINSRRKTGGSSELEDGFTMVSPLPSTPPHACFSDPLSWIFLNECCCLESKKRIIMLLLLSLLLEQRLPWCRQTSSHWLLSTRVDPPPTRANPELVSGPEPASSGSW